MVDKTTKEPPSANPSWPPYVPLVRSFQENSLLAGTEPLVWRALGNVKGLESLSKQLAIREALRELKLGWVATNTTPFRIVVGKLYDHALAVKREQKHSLENKEPDAKQAKIQLPKLEIVTENVPSNPSVQGPFLNDQGESSTSFTKAQRGAVWSDINKYGACVIRSAISEKAINALYPKDLDSDRSEEPAASKVTDTQGTGVSGSPPSHYEDMPKPYSDELIELEKSVIDLLLTDDLPEQTQQRKHIVLKFGVNGENWAHRDDHHDEAFPIQAELLMSEPKKDFNGGEFYIARRDDDESNGILRIRRSIVQWENAGDLIMFHGSYGSGWWHGLEQVKEGDSGKQATVYPRKSIGMLQPLG